MKLLAEQIQCFPGESFRLLRWGRTLREVEAVDSNGLGHPFHGSGHAWHHHAQAELTLIVRGEGMRFIGDSIGPFKAPDLVLLGPGLPHYWHETGGTSGFAIQFGVEFEHPFWQFPEADRLRGLWQQAARGIRFGAGAIPDVAAAIRAAEAGGGVPRLAHLIQIMGRLSKLTRREWTPISSPAFASRARPATYRGIQTAIHAIFESFPSPLSVRDVLERSGMSKATFDRQFRRHTGRTFTRFLAEVRLNHAARQLAGTDDSVSRIAEASGYANLSHFHHQFLAFHRMSPRRYREWIRRPGRRSAS